MKKLFICCDGTWNSKDNRDDGELAPTNVRKIYNCLKPVPKEQLVHYQEGVGTGGLFDKVLGGMVGVGLSEDIKECYLWLCDKYQAKDTIALLGFSRGAYTARLMGAVANGGNPQKDGTHAPLESFEIGDKARYQVKGNGGYLYCYPNDAWGFYGNNRGYVTLKVEVV